MKKVHSSKELRKFLYRFIHIICYLARLMKTNRVLIPKENARQPIRLSVVLFRFLCSFAALSIFSGNALSAEGLSKQATLKCQELFTLKSEKTSDLSDLDDSLRLTLEKLQGFLSSHFQDKARKVHERLNANDFEVSRGIIYYSKYFGSRFVEVLNRLQLQSNKGKSIPHWLDSGAGEAEAMADLLDPVVSRNQSYSFPIIDFNLTALSYAKADEGLSIEYLASQLGYRFQYLTGKYFEDYQPGEIRPANLITDVFGPFSYSMTPDVVLQKYLDLLQLKGSVFLVVSKKTSIANSSLEDYFNSIGGVEIYYPYSDGTRAPFKKSKLLTLQIVKKSHNVTVPRLEGFPLDAERPPTRHFRIVK